MSQVMPTPGTDGPGPTPDPQLQFLRADPSDDGPRSTWSGGWVRGHWQRLSARERRALGVAAAFVAAALLWWVGLAPAWSTLKAVDSQRPLLERQLRQMLAQQAQARAIQAQPRPPLDEARRLLESASRPLAPALQLAFAGDRVTVTLKGLRAEALAQWLVQVQLTARLVPTEVRLRRSGTAAWDGTLVLPLGAP